MSGSLTELHNLSRSRFDGALPQEALNGRVVEVVGLGSVGSHLAYALAKMGFAVSGFDPDTVDPENIGTQLFGPMHLGLPKAQALHTLLSMLLASSPFSSFFGKYQDTARYSLGERSVLCLCTDSMESRKEIVEESLGRPVAELPGLIVDTRVALDYCTVLFARPRSSESILEYKKTLYSDEEASPLPCRARMLISTSMAAAAVAAAGVKRWALGGTLPHQVGLDLKCFMAFGLDGE